MAKILIPRSDSVSAKVIEPSDFERLFDEVSGDFISSGFTVTAGSGLAVNISTGTARVKGLYLNNDSSTSKGSLTASQTNYIYLTLARDGNSEAESWDFTSNTTGTTPTDSFKIGSATCDGSSVTAVRQSTPDITKRYSIIPTGTIQMYGGQYNKIPSGWLLCDGTAVSRTTYAELYDVVGDQFGAGNGSSTFNLPDLRAKFPRGAPASTNGGGTGGADTHTLTADEMPEHSHGLSGGSGTAPSGCPTNGPCGSSYGSTGGAGGGQAHNNMPAYQQVLYMIRV